MRACVRACACVCVRACVCALCVRKCVSVCACVSVYTCGVCVRARVCVVVCLNEAGSYHHWPRIPRACFRALGCVTVNECTNEKMVCRREAELFGLDLGRRIITGRFLDQPPPRTLHFWPRITVSSGFCVHVILYLVRLYLVRTTITQSHQLQARQHGGGWWSGGGGEDGGDERRNIGL